MSRLLLICSALLAASAVADKDRARATFEKLLETSEITLTADERAAFEARFVKAMAASDDFFDDEFVQHELFTLEMPAVYESAMEKYRANATWEVGMNPSLAHLSEREYRGLNGFMVNFEGLPRTNPRSDPNGEGFPPPAPYVTNRRHNVKEGDLPKDFAVWEKWPQCTSMTDIRNQSECGSCWAVSVAAAYSDRLCIASDGAFNKHVSGQFMTSCMPQAGNGCNGGDPAAAWYMLHAMGIPTGGEYQEEDTGETCYPYAISPSGAQYYFDDDSTDEDYIDEEDFTDDEDDDAYGEMKTPKCELQCTDKLYPRTMEKDMIRMKDRQVLLLNDIDSIKYELFHHGPVVAAFFVSEDIKYYKSGVYTPTIPWGNGGHAVRVVGWGEEKKNGRTVPYWLISNSWGVDFGESGLIKYEMGYSQIESWMHAGNAQFADVKGHVSRRRDSFLEVIA